MGTTAAALYNVGVVGGRPKGTTQVARYEGRLAVQRVELGTGGYQVGICTNFNVDISGCDLQIGMYHPQYDNLRHKLRQRIHSKH